MGDGFLATFDGPARGVRCAEAIAAAIRPLGSRSAPACIPARWRSTATTSPGSAWRSAPASARWPGANEVLVSQTVKDLVAGVGLTFEDAGEHELKGVPDRWHLYRVLA